MTARAWHDLDKDRLGEHDFRRLAQFVHSVSGIKLPPTKKTMLESRLRRRVRALGLPSLAAYCRHVFDGPGGDDECVNLIDAVTTNKTEFFREPWHFEFLWRQGLPALAERGAGVDRPVRVWSAAASTGAEAYTLAMVLSEWAEANRGFRFEIVASDICTEVLSTALRAVYPEDMMDPIPQAMRSRYVLRSRDRSRRLARMSPAIRESVRLFRQNLMDDTYAVERQDVIFCRNLLIYFDHPTQEAVLAKLCDRLLPGGYLVLGHSESLAGLRLPVRAVASTVFVRE